MPCWASQFQVNGEVLIHNVNVHHITISVCPSAVDVLLANARLALKVCHKERNVNKCK